MNTIKNLFKNKNDPKSRVKLTFFFINLFLIMCHIFLMVIYMLVNHEFMVYINCFSLLFYISHIFSCIKNTKRYVYQTLIEIWIHMTCAVLAFGWKPCFQNWSFALIAAYFLPVYSNENEKRDRLQAFFISFIIIVTYFLISVLIHVVDTGLYMKLDDTMLKVLFTANNLFTFFAIVMFTLFYTSSSRRHARELSRKADFDELTNLYNRHAMNEIIPIIMEKACERKTSYNIAILDIDFFKDVNDTYGHKSGDDVLKKLANILKIYENNGIVPGRWGGEEFVLVSPSDMSYKQFLSILKKLRVKISKTKFKIEDNKTINLTISIGSTYSNNYESYEGAVAEADANLYKAKNTGRNKVIG